MEAYYDIQKLLALRKLTRAVADLLRSELKEYLSVLGPQLRPRTVLGDYVQSSMKGEVKGADKAFKELQSMFEAVAFDKPFNLLPKEVKPPLEVASTIPELLPMEYAYEVGGSGRGKAVAVTSPLKWMLAYPGFAPSRLKELLSDRDSNIEGIRQFILHYLVLHIVTTKQTGLTKILEALHFPLVSERHPGLGQLPVTCIQSSISTVRPPDDIIVQSTEISGTDAFEEVVNLEDISKLRDPFKERLTELVKSYGEHLLPPQEP